MVRVARAAKTLINIGLCMLFLLILYLLNTDEGQFDPDIRDNILSEYDDYMDAYDIDSKEVRSLVLEDLNDFEEEENQTGEAFLRKGAEERRKMVEELVVVVVDAGDDENSDDVTKKEGGDGEALEAPSESTENDDVDVLRENDVMVDNIIIDRSEDLLDEMKNQSLDQTDVTDLVGGITVNVSDAYYKPMDLLPLLSKPPSDRDAPGEFGHPFSVPSRLGPSVERQIEEGYRRHAFNVLVSDIISVHRNLGDKREEDCKGRKVRKPLPTFSVIICFRNEALSTLLRTLYSVLETVPGLLLKEVVLVDDASNIDLYEVMKTETEDLFSVKLIRSPTQVGITQARILGEKLATGEVLTFLDSHCECYEGWLEPLLERIKENRRVVALPIMEIINPDNFKFSVTPMQKVQRGGFDWTLTYRWIAPPRGRFQNPLMDMTQPVTTPTMSGGVFAIDRKYFQEMGNYDEGMKIWGAENLEMSYRIWMCGGRIEILPCSHVGHVFKARSPHHITADVVLRNKRRVAEVWMDEYKDLFYKRTPQALQVEVGNVTARQELRTNLQCKSFKWYMENIYPELYVPELKPKHSGAVCCRFGDSVDVCLDTGATETIPGRTLGVDKHQTGLLTQYFEFTKQNEIRHVGVRDVCVTSNERKIELQRCRFPGEKVALPQQQWVFNEDLTLLNKANNLCLTASTANVWLEKCDSSLRQKWRWI
ncbi:polypeptide N-acetylgalactosaminyltransferase 4-like [Clavelina lepadiformis]|uniref:polypeptide N-acetylgalactosaminyltransferase 4-like n=1 Tax=Clavelina lepadiformis TaxID=159417 RepID=UPI00404319ED